MALVSVGGRGIRVGRQGFTQAEFAGLANVGITYLSNLENGKPTAEIEKAIRILTMLGIDLYVEKR